MYSPCEGIFFVIHLFIHTLFSCFALLQMGYFCLFHSRHTCALRVQHKQKVLWSFSMEWCAFLMLFRFSPPWERYSPLPVCDCEKYCWVRNGENFGRFWCLQHVTSPVRSTQRFPRGPCSCLWHRRLGLSSFLYVETPQLQRANHWSCLPFTW